MTTLQVNHTLACEGLACPLPIVRTRKAMEELGAGEVLEVRATDQGSVADLKSWSKRVGHQYIGMKKDGEVFRHFIRKANPAEAKEETRHPHTMTNVELARKLEAGDNIIVIDVREPAEFAFGRIPGAISLPLGELEQRLGELNPQAEYAVVCRTGHRSDLACQTLMERGFLKVHNVLPGMSEWEQPLEKDDQ